MRRVGDTGRGPWQAGPAAHPYMGAFLQSLTDLVSASPWTYAAVFAIAALDAVFPVVPSETMLVAAAALAVDGDLYVAAVFAAGATGAFLGDNSAYGIGRLLGDRFTFKKLAWAERQLEERGGEIVLVSRFIPGGRTAVMLTAGATKMRYRRFALLDAGASVAWAAYGCIVGAIGGHAFKDQPLLGVGVALGIALLVAGASEGIRHLRRRNRPQAEPEEQERDAA
jgi:membrane-associated protein